jgi:hypothetical protein
LLALILVIVSTLAVGGSEQAEVEDGLHRAASFVYKSEDHR